MSNTIFIETTVLWQGGKEKALSGQKNDFLAAFGGALRTLFAELPGFTVAKRPRGAPFAPVVFCEDKEVIRLTHKNPETPFARRQDRALEAEFLIRVDISDMSEEVRGAFLSVLFRFLTYGRGIMGREPNIFQERLSVNGIFIRLPDVMGESVEPQREQFMEAILQ